MTTLTVRQTQRLAHKANLALTLAIVLGSIEFLRRVPRLLLLLLGLLVCTAALFVIAYVWWIVGALAAIVGWKLTRGAVRGWRECEVGR